MSFSDWSSTASLNVTVGGVAIGEGCPPSNLNNMGREIMAELRAAFAPGLASFFSAPDTVSARVVLGALSSNGGTVSGDITRLYGGGHLYHANPAFATAGVFFTAPGAADPTSFAGQIWITGS